MGICNQIGSENENYSKCRIVCSHVVRFVVLNAEILRVCFAKTFTVNILKWKTGYK